jgi:hypothetical protein
MAAAAESPAAFIRGVRYNQAASALQENVGLAFDVNLADCGWLPWALRKPAVQQSDTASIYIQLTCVALDCDGGQSRRLERAMPVRIMLARGVKGCRRCGLMKRLVDSVLHLNGHWSTGQASFVITCTAVMYEVASLRFVMLRLPTPVALAAQRLGARVHAIGLLSCCF